jgi:hypothetical protein
MEIPCCRAKAQWRPNHWQTVLKCSETPPLLCIKPDFRLNQDKVIF